MSRILKLLLFVAFVLVPTAAFATDMEYYTYGGFQPIVSAFKLIAAIFGNNSYRALFYTVVVSAASFAGLAALAREAMKLTGVRRTSSMDRVEVGLLTAKVTQSAM